MSDKGTKNMTASIRQRLLNRARNDQRPFSELLQYFAMERFLYRLSQSVHANRFVLKGAMMLKVWQSPELRPTMDIDLLGRTSNEFITLKQAQWVSFHRRLQQTHIPEDLAIIVLAIKSFIEPLTTGLSSDQVPPERWTAPGPWL